MDWQRYVLLNNLEPATSHLFSILSLGGTLSRNLPSRLTGGGKQGGLSLIASAGIDAQGIVDFSSGILSSSISSFDGLTEYFHAYLHQHSNTYVVSDNLCAKRSDPFINNLKSRVVFFSEEVLHVITPENRSRASIKSFVKESESALGLICVCCSGIKDATFDNPLLLESSLIEIGDSVSSIVVSALDGEAYLIWEQAVVPVVVTPE